MNQRINAIIQAEGLRTLCLLWKILCLCWMTTVQLCRNMVGSRIWYNSNSLGEGTQQGQCAQSLLSCNTPSLNPGYEQEPPGVTGQRQRTKIKHTAKFIASLREAVLPGCKLSEQNGLLKWHKPSAKHRARWPADLLQWEGLALLGSHA